MELQHTILYQYLIPKHHKLVIHQRIAFRDEAESVYRIHLFPLSCLSSFFINHTDTVKRRRETTIKNPVTRWNYGYIRWMCSIGLEPTTFWATTRRSSQLSYEHHPEKQLITLLISPDFSFCQVHHYIIPTFFLQRHSTHTNTICLEKLF